MPLLLCKKCATIPPPRSAEECRLAIKKTTHPSAGDEFWGVWNLEEQNWGLGSLGGEGRADAPISVGPRKIPVFTTRTVLPTLVPIISRGPPVVLSKPVIGRAQPPDTEKLQKVITQGPVGYIFDGIEYINMASARVAQQGKAHLLAPGMIVGQAGYEAPGPFMPNPIPGSTLGDAKEDGTMDLGDLLGNIASTFINVKYGGGGAGITPAGVAPTYGTGGMDGSIAATPALGLPFVDVIPEAGSKGMVYSPRANCGAGGWVKRRRRRKRLATVSDIKDIAALKAVMGPAMLKTWIATHS